MLKATSAKTVGQRMFLRFSIMKKTCAIQVQNYSFSLCLSKSEGWGFFPLNPKDILPYPKKSAWNSLSSKALCLAGASSDSVQYAHGQDALSGHDWMWLAPLTIPANLGREPKNHTWHSGPVQGGWKQGVLNLDCQHNQGFLALRTPLFWSLKIRETQGHT